jgi:simple sugar transport system permease protein
MTSAVSAAAATRYAQRGLIGRIRSHPAGNVTIVFLVAVALCIVAGLAVPEHFRFLSPANLNILMRAIPIIGIISLGVGILMISGEYDLSVGAAFGLSSYVMVLAFTSGVPILAAVVLALAVGVVIGLANGWITLSFGIPSFITTLGTLFILRSGGRIVSGNTPISFFPPDWFQSALTGNLFGMVQMQFVWFVLLALFAYLLLNRHWLGNHFYAVGGNRRAAVQVGINVTRTKLTAFAICSLFAVLAGILSVTRINSGTTETQLFIELEAVAVCVMGGLALTGGRGTILGIFIGACMFHLVKDVILLARLPGFYLDFFVGLTIVFGVTMNQFAKKRY